MIIFIIPVYNSEATIGKCIESILDQDVEKKVIVVDNGSTDKTADIIKKYPVKYIYEPKRGPAAAKNRGLKEVPDNAEFVAFIDSDVVLPKDWTQKALKMISINTEIAGVGGPGKSVVKNIISETFDYLLYGRIRSKKKRFVNSLATMNVLYRWQSIKGKYFNEKLISAAAEDVDFNFKIIKNGYKLVYSEDLWVYHHNPTTIKQVLAKWYNYGKYYPLPYFWNNRLNDIGLWGRIFYLPLLMIFFIFGIFAKNFFPFFMIISAFPVLYLLTGIKAGIKNIFRLFIFSGVHSLKQFFQILGIWTGILERILK